MVLNQAPVSFLGCGPGQGAEVDLCRLAVLAGFLRELLDVLQIKRVDRLQHAVFINFEVALLQVRGGIALAVRYADVHQDLIRADLESVVLRKILVPDLAAGGWCGGLPLILPSHSKAHKGPRHEDADGNGCQHPGVAMTSTNALLTNCISTHTNLKMLKTEAAINRLPRQRRIV